MTASVISKPFDDGVKEHHFIRADLHASKDDAEACAMMKGKRIVDEALAAVADGRSRGEAAAVPITPVDRNGCMCRFRPSKLGSSGPNSRSLRPIAFSKNGAASWKRPA